LEASLLTNLLLPLALGIVMLGLGLSLTAEDFARVVRFPRAVFVGLFVQTVVLTAVAFGLAVGFGLPPELAVGLMLLAASPGGATANVYSHLAQGDVALNITLTAVNSVLALAWLPLVVNWSLEHFLGAGQYVPPPTRKIVEVAALIVVPVVVGMILRARAPRLAERAEKPIRIFAILFLAALVAGAVAAEWDRLGEFLAAVGLACLAFNLLSMAAGYFAPLALRLPKRQAIAIAMEIGIHNGTLAIYVALNVLGNAAMSVPAAVYSLIMFVTAAVFAVVVQRNAARAPIGRPSG
jgi:BASS family bile acid:Na+ symporter